MQKACRSFQRRYHSYIKMKRPSRHLKSLRFTDVQNSTTSQAGSLTELNTKLERLENLANDECQRNKALCAVLWSAVEGNDCSLHEQEKRLMIKPFPKSSKQLPIRPPILKSTIKAEKQDNMIREDQNSTRRMELFGMI